MTAQRAEGTKVLRRQKTGGTINIYQTDRGQKITHLCRWLILLKFTRFLGGPNGLKICSGRTKTDFKDRGLRSFQLLEYARISKMTAEQLRLPLSSPLNAKAARALLEIYTLHKLRSFKYGNQCTMAKFQWEVRHSEF